MSEAADIPTHAAEWILRLDADDPAERAAAQAGFERWQQADPRHASAAAQLQKTLSRLRSFGHDADSAAAARKALQAGAQRRRSGRRSLTLVALLAMLLPALLMQRSIVDGWRADLRTATGEWQQRTLADGSRLLLGSDSAVAFDFTPQQRRVTLLRGALQVDVAADAARPFVVETAQADIVALGTRFSVELDGDATELAMLESRTAVTPKATGTVAADAVVVTAGQGVRIRDGVVSAPWALDVAEIEDRWRLRRWVVRDRPLAEALDVLARHRRGWISYDRAALHGLRISAVLPLDDPERALRLLDAGLAGVRVRHYTPWLVRVDRETPEGS